MTAKQLTADFIMKCLSANELGDGTLYAAIHDGQFVFNKTAQEWLSWTGHYWELDELEKANVSVENVAMTYVQEAHNMVDQINKAVAMKNDQLRRQLEDQQKKIYRRVERLRSTRGRAACLNMAHLNSEKPLAILGEQLDQDPWLLSCANGVVDLQTGDLRPGRPDDYLSKASPVTYETIETPCPMWEKTLSEIFAGDPELVEYVQRFFGYAVTGVPKENVLPILWGQGRNGKTTIVETISRVLGPLAAPIQSEMLLDQGRSRSSAGPSPDIMALRGLRMAFASEADEGRKFSPSRIKWLSGSDTLVGRSPHDRRQTSFRPTHTLILLTNHKPHAPASDFAFWERVHLIPFNFSFVDRDPQKGNEFRADKDLPTKLDGEAPGILAWLVRGCLKWQQRGLDPPQVIRDATNEYRRDEDLLADFLEDRCIINPESREFFKDLYQNFTEWFEENISKRVPTGHRFAKLLKAANFETGKSGDRYYQGLRLIRT